MSFVGRFEEERAIGSKQLVVIDIANLGAFGIGPELPTGSVVEQE